MAKTRLKNTLKFKIHAISSVTGKGHSANNNKFYDTFEEAYHACEGYMRRGDGCEGFVIMKTYAVLRHATPPTESFLFHDCGDITEFVPA